MPASSSAAVITLPRSYLRLSSHLSGAAQPIVHADVEVEHDEDRGLQAVGEVEGLGAEIEGLGRILGEQQHVLGVAVRGVGAGDEVGLLRARRHAGRRAGALHVEHHGRNFGEIGEPEEFLHQRDAGAGGGGEGAGAVPGRADHHADRGQLVLGLDDGDRFCLVSGSTRSRLQWLAKASASEVDGVIGYQAHTVAPP